MQAEQSQLGSPDVTERFDAGGEGGGGSASGSGRGRGHGRRRRVRQSAFELGLSSSSVCSMHLVLFEFGALRKTKAGWGDWQSLADLGTRSEMRRASGCQTPLLPSQRIRRSQPCPKHLGWRPVVRSWVPVPYPSQPHTETDRADRAGHGRASQGQRGGGGGGGENNNLCE